MKAKSESNSNFITILDRAFKVLDCILDSPEPVGVSQLSKITQIPKANVFRILKTLEALDAIVPVGDGFALGSRLIKYGNGAKQHNRLVPLVTPCMQKLCKDVGETINLGVQYKNEVLVIHTELADMNTLVAFLSPVTPLFCSSIGKHFLAQMSDDELENYFETQEITLRTVNSITTKDGFIKEREEILSTGIAYDREEYDYGLSCLAAPVKNKDGKTIAGLSISGPTSRLSFKGLNELEEKLRAAANELSDLLIRMEIDGPEIG